MTKEKTAKKSKDKIKVLKSNDDNNSDDDKKNVIIITRWIDLTNNQLLRMFNNIVLNMLIIKLTVNHVNKDILMSTDLLIDSEVTVHMIVN